MIAAAQPGGRLVVAAFMLVALAGPASIAAAQTDAERLVGVYRLARYTPHGEEPTGRISYDAAGRMWAMIFPPGREPATQATTDGDFRSIMRGVIA